MGSSESKLSENICEEDVYMENIPSRPILTPEPKKKFDELDPRSPSLYLSRTPLQLPSETPGKLVEPNGELYELDSETPLKNKTVLLGIDPRSPTTEFKRTPIVIKVEDSNVPKKIHNKNLDKVKQSIILGTPKAEKVGNIVPPKLLESSPIKTKHDINKRKSFVGLLETNIDFTETDLDAVIQEKYRIKEKMLDNITSPITKPRINLASEDINPRSTTNDFLRTPIQLAHIIDETERITSKENNQLEAKEVVVELEKNLAHKEEEVYEACGTIQVENETVNEQTEVVSDSADISGSLEEVLEPEVDSIAEIKITNVSVDSVNTDVPTEIKSAPITPPTSAVKEFNPISPAVITEKQIKSAPVTPPVVNITADVNELDKKLTNLIYQDEDVVVCPRIVKLKENSNRSPLRNCNGAEPDRRRSIPKLKVSDKPRKSDYAVSRIPVFKDKTKGHIQCENTPPRNMETRKVKAKRSQWDNADKTLVI